jgi:anti-anti-sigma factor
MSTITTRVSQDGRQLTIAVAGRFDFSVHREFRNAYTGHDVPNVSYVVDLSRTEYMDSSALGMVLLLREYAGGNKARVELHNARPDVEKILRIANFDKLLTLKGALA